MIYDLMEKRWYKDPTIYNSDNYLLTDKQVDNESSNTSKEISEQDSKIINKNVPCLRKNHVSVLVGYTILVYGGINQNEEFLNDAWIYNIRSREWSVLNITGRSPPQLAFHSAVLAIEDDKIYEPSLNIFRLPISTKKTVPLLKEEGIFFFGGMNDNRIPTNLFFMLKIGKKEMQFEIPKIDGKPPEPRISATMNFYVPLNYLIVHGGRNDKTGDTFLNDFVLLDLENKNWIHTSVKKDTITRSEHGAVILGNKLLILGGCNDNKMIQFNPMLTMLDIV